MSTRTPAGWIASEERTRCLTPNHPTDTATRMEIVRRIENERHRAAALHILRRFPAKCERSNTK